MEKYNLLNEDVYASTNINEIDKIYSGKNENVPISIFCCMNGEVSLQINGTEYVLKSKQLLILGSHSIVERCIASSDARGNILYVSERILFDNLDNIIWENAFTLGKHPIISIDDKTASLFECYGMLFYTRLQQKERLYKDEVINSLLRAIMLELMNEIQNSHEKVETPGNKLLKQGDILFKRFIALLSKSEIKPRMVSWYAQELCITPKYLSTTCKSVSGKTANEWINEFVVRDIHKLLKYSDKSIKEICEYLNFPNLSFFGKFVKAHLGSSPKDYRKRIKNEQ